MKLKVLSILTLMVLLSTTLGLKPVRGSSLVETRVYVDPLLSFAIPSEIFNVDIMIADVANLYAWQVNMTFDPSVLQYVNVTEGDFLKGRPEGTSGLLKKTDKASEGKIFFGCVIWGAYAGISGSGILATVKFRVLAYGESLINISDSQTVLIDDEIKDVASTKENGYFTSNAIDRSTYNQLLDLYNQLLANHNTLLANYSMLLASYYSSNSSYYSLLAEYQDLQSEYDSLESDYDSLNATYNSLLDSYAQLQANQSSLQSKYENLSDNYDELETAYHSLNTAYNSLKADYDDLKSRYETSTGELGTARNLNYVLIITAIAFVVSTVYVLLKKPKGKPT